MYWLHIKYTVLIWTKSRQIGYETVVEGYRWEMGEMAFTQQKKVVQHES